MSKYVVNLLDALKPFVERPFAEKFLQTQGIIAKNLHEHWGKAAVSWSGGKDSTLVLYLVRQLAPNVDVVFNNTGIEYPETVRFIHNLAATWNLNLIETTPKKTFWKCAEEFGYPGGSKRGTVHCCYYLKEKPTLDQIRVHGWEAVFDGLTATESWTRMFNARDRGTCYFKKHWKVQVVHPILYWTEEEVFGFFESEGIPNNPLYSQGARRVGCMACTAYKTWEVRMAAENPKLYAIIKLRKDGQYSLPLEGAKVE